MKQFALFTDKEVFEDALGIHTEADFIYKPNYNVSTGNTVPGIFKLDGEAKLGHFVWGVSGLEAEHTLSFHFEQAEGKRSDLLKSQRCLIPANGFFIWKQNVDDPHPFYIRKISSAIFFMAAVYEIVKEENGHLRKEFSVVLEDANDLIKPVTAHMPLIVERNQLSDWLNGKALSEFRKSNHLIQLADFITNRVPEEVNDPTLNKPELIQPIPKLREEDD